MRRRKILCCGKVTRRFCSVNAFQRVRRQFSRVKTRRLREEGNFTADETERAENLLGDGALQEFSEGLAERKDLSEVVRGAIGASGFRVMAFAADLDHTNDAIPVGNRAPHD